MRGWLGVVILMALVASCGGRKPAPAPAPIANHVEPPPADAAAPARGMAAAFAKLDEFTAQMCRCHDATCAQQVSEDMTRWSEQMAREDPHGTAFKPTDEEMKRMSDVTRRLVDCMTKAMAVGSGSMAPPAPPPPSP